LSYEYKTKPHDHQVKILKDSWGQENWGIFAEMGTGKSKIVIDSAAAMYEREGLDGVLIVAPKGNYRNWEDEIDIHLPERIDRTVVTWKPSKSKTFTKELNRLWATDDSLHFFLVNVEALSSKTFDNPACQAAEKFVLNHDSMLVVDESTCIKTESASRTKSCVRLAKSCRWRRVLTGTPVTETPLDLWGQACVLSGGNPETLIGHSSFFSFRNHFCHLKKMDFSGRRAFQVVTGYRNIEELADTISGWSSRVTKAECLDLPPKSYTKYDVELTTEQKSLYKKVREEARIDLEESKSLSIMVAVSRLMRLRQVLSGFLPVDPEPISVFGGLEGPEGSERDDLFDHGREVVEIPENRTKALLEVAENLRGKALVWACFRRTVSKLVDVLEQEYGKGSAAGYSGETKTDDRKEAIRRFQDPEDPLRFLVLNRAGAYGITLTEAHTAIYYENDWSLEVRMQSEDRCHRIGTRSAVTYVDLCAQGTIDAKLIRALREKKEISKAILQEGVEEWI